MHPSTYENYAAHEEVHWWFRHRRALVRRLLQRAGDAAPGGVALDLGCGTGGNLALLGEFATTVVGSDLSERALTYCAQKRPDAVLVRSDVNALERTFAPASIGLIALFNVLYHAWVSDDGAVLAAAHRVLAPGGRLLVCEAAFESLRRQRDRLDYGARRYRIPPLRKGLEDCGFEIECATYFNLLGFPLVWLLARWDRWSGKLQRPLDGILPRDRDLDTSHTGIQRLAFALTGIERAWLARGGRLPFGINLLLMARKPL